jgi:hypothetical protein
LLEHYRISRFKDLHWWDGRRGNRGIAVVQAVTFYGTAMPAAIEAEHDPRLAIFTFSRNRQCVDCAIGVGNNTLRGGLPQALKITSIIRRIVSV